MSNEKSAAHVGNMNHFGTASNPDGMVEWREPRAPDLASGDGNLTTGRLRSCGYCGSMHPADLAVALKSGATAHWADFKYGWPHKIYVEGIPNPHAGMLESRMGASHALPVCPKTGAACEQGEQSFGWAKCECMKAATPTEATHGTSKMVRMQSGFSRETGAPEYTWKHAGEPARATTDGKFYTVHLQDATEEDRAVIEAAMGLTFSFEQGGRVSWQAITAAVPA